MRSLGTNLWTTYFTCIKVHLKILQNLDLMDHPNGFFGIRGYVWGYFTIFIKNIQQDGPSSGVKLDRTQVLEKTLSPSRPFDPKYLVTFGTLASLAPLAPLGPLGPLAPLVPYSTVLYCTVLYHTVTSLTDTHLLIKLNAWSFRQKFHGGWWVTLQL